MSDCKPHPLEPKRFKRDSVLSQMLQKGWIPRMESSYELDLCIRKAEDDLETMPEIDTLEDFIYHINYVFACEWDCSIQFWFELQEQGNDA